MSIKKNSNEKIKNQVILYISMLTRSSERIFNSMRYTGKIIMTRVIYTELFFKRPTKSLKAKNFLFFLKLYKFYLTTEQNWYNNNHSLDIWWGIFRLTKSLKAKAITSLFFHPENIYSSHAPERSCLNLVESNQFWTVITLFRLIWSKMNSDLGAPNWFGTKWNSLCCQINLKRVITTQIWFDLTRFRKKSHCGNLQKMQIIV